MKILVIEDEEKIANALKQGFEIESFAVDIVLNGRLGLNRIIGNHKDYDLIILDIMLPEIDGITICKEIRDQGIYTPVLMLTARDNVDNKIEGLDAGADDYLVKPFSFKELLARTRALLRRPKEAIPFKITCGNITLDTKSRTVIKSGNEIPLTLKEFSILEYMMRHPNQVLSRDNITNHIWDFAFDSYSNVVDVHIKNLRKKLQNKNEKIFTTIHGVGYKLTV